MPLRLQGKIRGSITPEDSKEFAAFYPAVATMPVSESFFRYDPSLGDLEQIGAASQLAMLGCLYQVLPSKNV